MLPGIAPARANEHSQCLCRLLVFAMLLGFMETVLDTALSPSIPGLVRDLGRSTPQVGTLTAACPAGIVLASVPVGTPRATSAPE